nr:hypothetical protein [uncultured Shinella sp.]
MLNGLTSTNLDSTPIADELLVNREGSTKLIPVMNFEQQLLAGAVGNAITLASAGILSAKTWPVLAAVAGTTALQKAEVTEDAGTHVDPVSGLTVKNEGYFSWSTAPAGWTRTGDRQDKLLQVDPIEQPAPRTRAEDAAGNREPESNESIVYDMRTRRVMTEDYELEVRADEDGLWIEDDAGNIVRFKDTTADTSWTKAEYAYAEGRAAAKALELNKVDLSHLPLWEAFYAYLLIFTGQSFNAASDNAKLFLRSTASWIAMAGYQPNTWSVGTDSRCVNSGPTYVTFGGNTRALSPLVEHFIAPTGTDAIYSDGDVAAGAYPDNARGGSPETLALNLFEFLAQRWVRATGKDTQRHLVPMNHAKTDGSMAQLGTGDGLSRMQSLVDVADEAFTLAIGGGAPANIPAGYGRKHLATLNNHGEADESLGTATYMADLQAFNAAINAKVNSKWGQSVYAPMLNLQVGGKSYGSANMVCARQQVDMMLDKAPGSANRYQFLVGSKYEVPSFVDVTQGSGHPNYGDGHPTLAGNALMAIRYAVGLLYLLVRREHYWLPFPYEVYFRENGTRFLMGVPNKFPPLRETPMPVGCVMQMFADKGITFENADGIENEVLWVRVVPGYNFLIEGECVEKIDTFTTMKSGKRLVPNHMGGTNFRDSFSIEHPVMLPFSADQTVYSGGYRDNPVTNELGRFLEDIPGLVGKPDLGNPMARYQVTAQPIPVL